ncbi:genome-derived Neisseria antigen 1220 [Neisseria meningitidis]|nr:genome-derived Neisseria antigen 1220 [Neisseria meningitidis]CWS32239.1 genome-derived Neisseria antigen 1220 [Neisseria meningitidis]
MEFFIILLVAVAVFGFKSFVVIPQQEVHVVERLGRFHRALTAGLNILIPFIDRVAYRHSLKEIPLDVPSQVCITRDNTQLTVDGIIYFQVTDPKLASYGSSNYIMAITQLAQTTLRSVIGRMELDKTFEERDEINSTVVAALDEAAGAWGVKVLRYEIKDLVPPQEILRSMQAQITAEREKRARIAESEGRKIEQINLASGQREAEIQQSEGEAQAAVNASNAEKIARINRAKGEAESLRLVAEANAEAIRQIAAALQTQGGADAVNLKIAEQYVAAFNNLAKESNTLIMPANVADIGSLISAGMKMPSEVQFSGFRRHFYLNPGKVVFRFKYSGLTKTSTALPYLYCLRLRRLVLIFVNPLYVSEPPTCPGKNCRQNISARPREARPRLRRPKAIPPTFRQSPSAARTPSAKR